VNDLDGQIEQGLQAAVLGVAHEPVGEIDEVRSRARRFSRRRRIRRAGVSGLVLVAVLVAGATAVSISSSRQQEWLAGVSFEGVERDGLHVEVPEGWSVQPEVGGGNPALVFWVSSRDVGTEAYCDDRGISDPDETNLFATDVIVQIRERYADEGAPSSPPVGARPEQLNASTMSLSEECRNADARFYRSSFTDQGRQFDVILVTGNEASSDSVALGWEVLNRFAVR